MAIPSGGGNSSQTFISSASYTEDITIIGDGENLVCYNTDGETDVVNRSAKQLANNCNFLYADHLRSDTSVVTTTTNTIYTRIAEFNNKVINYDATITLHANAFLGSTIEIKNLSGGGSLTIDLGGRQLTTFSAGTVTGIKFSNCNLSKIILTNGTITDGTLGTLTDIVVFENCPGFIEVTNMTTKHKGGGAGVNHYEFNNCGKVNIKTCTVEYGANGISASYFSHVLSWDNYATLATDPTGYGIIATTGAVISKGDAQQFPGTTAAELTATGGIIR